MFSVVAGTCLFLWHNNVRLYDVYIYLFIYLYSASFDCHCHHRMDEWNRVMVLCCMDALFVCLSQMCECECIIFTFTKFMFMYEKSFNVTGLFCDHVTIQFVFSWLGRVNQGLSKTCEENIFPRLSVTKQEFIYP